MISLVCISLMTGACVSSDQRVKNDSSPSPTTQPQPTNTVENKPVENISTNTNNSSQNNQINQPLKPNETQCSLNKPPELKGFFLGQTIDEIEKRVPGFKDGYEKEKELSTDTDKKAKFVLINSGILLQAGEDKNVKDYNLIWHFQNDKLVGLIIKYSNENPSGLESFLDKMAVEYNLPKDDWKVRGKEDADLECGSFKVTVSVNNQNGPGIMLTDSLAERERENRRK